MGLIPREPMKRFFFFFFECKSLWIKPSTKFVNVTISANKVDYYNRYGMAWMRQVYYTKSTGQSFCPNLLHPLWKPAQTNSANVKRFRENQRFGPSEAQLRPIWARASLSVCSASLWRLDCLPAEDQRLCINTSSGHGYSGPAVKTWLATAVENMIHAMRSPCQDTAALPNMCGGPEPLFPKLL